MLPLAGLAGYLSVQRKAEREAKAAAARWFEEHARELSSQIDTLQKKLQQLEGQAETAFNWHIEKTRRLAEQAQQYIQQKMSEPGKAAHDVPWEAANALAEVERSVKEKPEAQYTYQDWNNRAFAAYSQGEKEGAARFWRAAAKYSAASAKDIVIALFNAGVALEDLGRREEAIAVYDELVRRFGEATEVALREQVASALNGIGFDFLCNAKKIWKDGSEAAAIGLLAQALAKVEAALQHNPGEPVILGNQGYILFLLGRHTEAFPILTHAVALGGEELRKSELKDADIHPLPQDESFRALIKRL